MTDTTDNPPPLLTFPARFPIKIMGKNTPDFQAAVLEAASRLIPSDKLHSIDEKPSSNGRYLGMTIIAVFECQADIDAVYQALSQNPHVIMAL